MAKNLVIVESPAKAKTITKFLGSEYVIKASMGHVRDLPSKNLGFDPDNNFLPEYEVSKDKKKTIAELKKHIDKDTVIYLATDEDREGEAISWHLIDALKIKNHTLKRCVFHEITKGAIIHAIENPRELDLNLVNAQQARRILDRAVGYKLSPLLWKKVQRGLSAGRVQSVAVRIIVDREREIRAFNPEEFWKLHADFNTPEFSAELAKVNGKKHKTTNEETAQEHKKNIESHPITLEKIDKKDGKRSPAAPFTTSTLQQEAARKLGFSVKQTMALAQQLYEGNFSIPGYTGGLITYMRTDSVNLSDTALTQAKIVVTEEFGAEYAETRKYATKSKGAQEAHEAIRPVDLAQKPSDAKQHLDSQMGRLYELIWKRTMATQMKDAKIARTTFVISAGAKKEYELHTKGQQIVFPGFMKAYTEGSDDPDAELENKDKILPHVEAGTVLSTKEVRAEQHFTKPPARYTEASLVKKLEGEGIGRPSTYAPTISTIQNRGYVEKTEDKKLQPTDIAEVVTDFLVTHFSDIVDLGFTASVEKQFDIIADGKLEWTKMLADFYNPFIARIQDRDENVTRGEVLQVRELGTDPKSGKPVSVRIGRFGPMVQIGTKDDEDKPKFASLPKEMRLDEVKLEDILHLFDLPRTLGTDPEGEEITTNNGRFGPYVKKGKAFFSIKGEDPYTIELARALEIIKELEEKKAKALLHTFENINVEVREGRYGPYIKQEKDNYKIPKTYDVDKLTEAECTAIIEEAKKNPKKKFVRKKKKT